MGAAAPHATTSPVCAIQLPTLYRPGRAYSSSNNDTPVLEGRGDPACNDRPRWHRAICRPAPQAHQRPLSPWGLRGARFKALAAPAPSNTTAVAHPRTSFSSLQRCCCVLRCVVTANLRGLLGDVAIASPPCGHLGRAHGHAPTYET
ncbi:hypothetical protein NDU88_003021 [Pleurodeles waltl]|uniref:Uncharacterized protein n=1 Tax=Pleurodeles waltl TaxID=8319 RepID=A0AAV7M2A3_PLEWA|nr:hypothetical protein NDU88_003021 [Pleurodeles waltl]